MDVMTLENIKKLNYDPFDVSRQWGRPIIPLVPGIPGPLDFLFKGRRVFYRDTQNYRPIVDPSLPSRRLVVFESNAVDLGPPANFYNHVLTNDAQRQRLANSVAQSLSTTIEPIRGRALTLFVPC
ncbi:hypothetical protein ACJJTC_013146 [Scirpophaga incertulas]